VVDVVDAVDAVDAVVGRPEHPLCTHNIACIPDREGGSRRSFGAAILPFEGDLVEEHVGRRGEDYA
jgi:hypothetical protein